METTELFATKGIEYLLVIVYLALLVGGWKLVFPKSQEREEAHEHYGPLPDGYFFHQGHTWAAPVADDRVCVGLDDFAQKAIGHPRALVLPDHGSVLTAGEPAWEVGHADGTSFAMLSPVSGIVTAINDDVVHSPGLVNTQPYGEGWLFEVRVESNCYQRNLLTGELAEHWMELAYAVPPAQALAALLAGAHLAELR
jgi:glycine cleavage system H protein